MNSQECWEMDNLKWTNVEMDIYFNRQNDISDRFYRKIQQLVAKAKPKVVLNLYHQLSLMKY